MNILESERFKNAEREEQYFVLDPKYIKEALTSGIEFGTLQFFVYHYMRWCEEKGKFKVMAAGKEHIAEYLGATPHEVEKSLWDLSKKGAISYIDFQQNIIRAKKKFWVTNVKLKTIKLPQGSIPLPTGSHPLPQGSQSLPTGSLPSPVTPLSENNNIKDNIYITTSKEELGRAKALPHSYFDVREGGPSPVEGGTVGAPSTSNLTNVEPCSTLDVSKTNVGEKGNSKVDYKGIVSEVASILGLQKVAWGQAIKTCKQCIENGFTKDDIIAAANNMKAGDRRYYSIYSLFIKTDYWLNKTEQSDDKGKLSW